MEEAYIIPKNDYLLNLINNVKKNVPLCSEIMIIEKLKAYIDTEDSHDVMIAYFKKMFELEIEKVPLSFKKVLNFIINTYKKDHGFINNFNPDYFYSSFLNVKDLEEKYEININWHSFAAIGELIRSSENVECFFNTIMKDLNGFPLKSEINLLTPVSYWIGEGSNNFNSEIVKNIEFAIKDIFIKGLNVKDETFHMESIFDVKNIRVNEELDFTKHKIILDKSLIDEHINAERLSYLLNRMQFLSGSVYEDWLGTEILKNEMKLDLSKLEINKKKVKKF